MNELNHYEEISKTLPKEIRNKNPNILNMLTASKKNPIVKQNNDLNDYLKNINQEKPQITKLLKKEKDLSEKGNSENYFLKNKDKLIEIPCAEKNISEKPIKSSTGVKKGKLKKK